LKAGLIPFAVLIAPLFLFIGSAVATPSPVVELNRLFNNRNDDMDCAPVQDFIKTEIKSGDRVAIIHPYGYQLANNCGIRNYFPFAGHLSILSREQFEFVLREFEKNNVTDVFIESVKWVLTGNIKEERQRLLEHGYHLKNKLDYSHYPIEYRKYEMYSSQYQVEHWIK
jgi:hypothetical protein